MFWQQLNLQETLLNDLVTKEDTTLDRVLEEPDVIQECKVKNARLNEFLARTENMHQLINYIIVEPPEDEDEKVKFYKSHVCCELLSSDVPIITDTLANDSILISQLWGFIRTRDEVNPLLASFFSKVVQLLLNRRPNSILEFLKDEISLIDDLVHHIDTSAVMDLLNRIVCCFENSITRFKVCHWLRDVRLIEKLVDSLSDDASNEALCNTCQLLNDILKVCRDPQESFKGAKDALLIELEGEDTIQKIVDSITSSKNTHLINHGVGVLQTYLTKPMPTSMVPNMMIEMDKPSIVILDSFIKCISENLEAIQEILTSTKSSSLGTHRLQVIRLIGLLVQCYSPVINTELVRLKTLDILWKLFLQHPFNNFLHTQVSTIMENILNTKVNAYDDALLLNYMIRDMKLLNKVEDAWGEKTIREDHSNPCKKRVRRAGYLGHVYKIATDIQDTLTNKENRKYIAEWLEASHSPSFWSEFCDTTLKEQRDKNESDLGPDPRRYHNNMDSDDDLEEKMGIKNFVNNPLFGWKTDEDDDQEFSFMPSNEFSEFKPVVIPEWKERNITAFAEADQTSGMQVQEGSSSEEEEEEPHPIKEAHDPWASQPQQDQEYSKMDTDVSWANFKSFVEPGSNGTAKEWPSTPPDGSVLHASPCKPDDKMSKYEAPGAEYVMADMNSNGAMICEENKLVSDAEVAGSMISDSDTAAWPQQQLRL